MSSTIPAKSQSHQVMVVSVITAAASLTVAALVAIAYMLGWLPPAGSAGIASPGQQATGSAPGVALLPGESVVTPDAQPAPAVPGPTTPNYARTAPATAPVPRNSTAAPVPRNPPPAPKRPVYARD